MDEVRKSELGKIISIMRHVKYNEIKDSVKISENNFSKSNFIKGICNIRTYNSINYKVIQNDDIYSTLLEKLGLFYKISDDEHNSNMIIIEGILGDLLLSLEYINDDLGTTISKKIQELNFENDCIAKLHIYLFETIINMQFLRKMENNRINTIIEFTEFYDGLYLALAYLGIGIFYINKYDADSAQIYLEWATNVFIKNNFPYQGIINSFLLSIYRMEANYSQLVPLAENMLDYYNKRNNRKRQVHIFSYLSDYYLIIGKYDIALEFHKKTIAIMDENSQLKRFEFAINYNWGLTCMKYQKDQDALRYTIDAFLTCSINDYKLKIINIILILLTKLKYSQNEIIFYIDEGKKYINESKDELQSMYFRYFLYKYEHPSFYRKYAIKQLIPYLKKENLIIEMIIFIYEDLYCR